jgi:hypothetical protein
VIGGENLCLWKKGEGSGVSENFAFTAGHSRGEERQLSQKESVKFRGISGMWLEIEKSTGLAPFGTVQSS